MDERDIKKRKPVLSIVAGILFTFFLIGSIAWIIYFLSSNSMDLVWILAALLTALGIATLVIVILSKKDRIKKCMIPLLIFTIIISGVDLVALMLASFKQGIKDGQTNDMSIAVANATIEKAKSAIPSKNLYLYTPETGESHYRYNDDDGSIASKFLSMEFTHLGSGSSQGKLPQPYGSYYFRLESELLVVFRDGFSGLTVYSQYSRGMMTGGPVHGWNTYSMKLEEGQQLKDMIVAKVAEQKASYEAKESETSVSDSSNLVFTF